MFAVNTYEEIERRERESDENHIVILLFVKPNLPCSNEIIGEFDYIHYNSDRFCSIYAVGYSNDSNNALYEGFRRIYKCGYTEWYFNSQKFVEFKNNLENRIKWHYSGETEILILQNSIGKTGGSSLNFQNYVAVDVNYGIRKGYIDSFPRFMESLVRASKSEVTATDAIKKVRKDRLKIKNLMSYAVEDCKKIPTPIKQIVKDRLFYRTSVSI